MKPTIGIIEWPYYDKDNDHIYEVMTNLVNWINYIGGYPIGIFPTQSVDFVSEKLSEIPAITDKETMDLYNLINKCDAIIKPGATRIYEHERLIYDQVARIDMPFLGICAGMQIMAGHGKQIYNIPVPKDDKCHIYVEHKNARHNVNIKRGTRLYDILRQDTIDVESRHRYHIATPGSQKISGVADDGVIEAIENPRCYFHIGVQWHPELEPFSNQDSENLFANLVYQAKVYSKRK